MKGLLICFFRHGIAVDDADYHAPSDPAGHARPLTEEGIAKTRVAAGGLKRMDLGFEGVFTSPWLRATQTAAIVAETLGLSPAKEIPELAGDRSPQDLLKAFAAIDPPSRTILVGHEPLLSAAATHVLRSNFPLELKKSGACAIEVDRLPPGKPGTLLWLLTSKQLRWIGKGIG